MPGFGLKICAVLLGLTLLVPGPVRAAAIASADLSVITSITGFSIDPGTNGTGVSVFAEVLPDDPEIADIFNQIVNGGDVSPPLPFGTATVAMGTADASSVSTSFTGSSTTQLMPTSATAVDHGDAGLAVAATDGVFTIDNSTGTSSIDVTFTVDYGYSVSAAVTGSHEYAEALISLGVFFELDGIEITSETIGIFSRVIAEGPLPDSAADSDTGFETVIVSVAAGSVLDVFSIADSQSLASIPEPSSLILFSTIAGSMAFFRRRRSVRAS